MRTENVTFHKKEDKWVSDFYTGIDGSTEPTVCRKNYNKRNDSSSIKDAMVWDECLDQDVKYARYRNDYRMVDMSKTARDMGTRSQALPNSEDQRFSVTTRERQQPQQFADADNYIDKAAQTKSTRATTTMQNTTNKAVSRENPRNQSQNKIERRQKAQSSAAAERLSRATMKKDKSAERLKIQSYVQSLVPYTRDLSNTRFRMYYGKAPMETYGRDNLNEPAGGIIYGNHMKTFNIMPHSNGQNPKYYQTHTTALNYGKRTKLNEQDKWKRLEKEMSKKLGLKVTNESLKEGKDVQIVQITEDNMEQVMKQTLDFRKQNFDQIRKAQLQFQKDKAQEQKQAAEEYKQQRIAQRQAYWKGQTNGVPRGGVPQDQVPQVPVGINNQIVYKIVDEDGVARYAPDRHGITCYVDMNFPENDQAYTQELIKRNPIQPTEVKQKDKNLDEIRKQNYVDSVVNCYPAHYLVPNVDYSQVKWGSSTEKTRERSRSRERVRQNAQTELTRPSINKKVSFRDDSTAANQSRVYDDRVRTQNNRSQPQDDEMRYQGFSNQNQYYNQNENPCRNPDDDRRRPSTARASYGPDIKQCLLDRAERDPHLASRLLSMSKTTCLCQNGYDPSRYIGHQLNPRNYSPVDVSRIPAAGQPSSQIRYQP